MSSKADEQSINYTLAQLLMVMERLDTQIGAHSGLCFSWPHLHYTLKRAANLMD